MTNKFSMSDTLLAAYGKNNVSVCAHSGASQATSWFSESNCSWCTRAARSIYCKRVRRKKVWSSSFGGGGGGGGGLGGGTMPKIFVPPAAGSAPPGIWPMKGGAGTPLGPICPGGANGGGGGRLKPVFAAAPGALKGGGMPIGGPPR